MDTDGEEEYYKEEVRMHLYTTKSGRKVYSVARLIVPLPGEEHEEDLKELEEFDEENGSSCVDGLSERSFDSDDESSSEEEEDDDDDFSGSEF